MISSFVLASVTCVTFAIEVGRMELTMLALLASIENKYVAGERLPKVPYRTLIDKNVDASFMTQIFTVISTVLVENYEEKDL
jgi:hypothetical protein